jgi:hypothetical protein
VYRFALFVADSNAYDIGVLLLAVLASEHSYFVDHTMTNIFLVLWLRVIIPVALKQLAEWLDERRASKHQMREL